jgi:predicted nucleic acid-binding Zn ribbon protein
VIGRPTKTTVKGLTREMSHQRHNFSRKASAAPAPTGGIQQLSDVLAAQLARRGYAHVESASAASAAWEQAVGAELAADTRPGNIRRGTLEVTVRDSVVLQELTFQKQKLERELAENVPELGIRQIRFRVGAID